MKKHLLFPIALSAILLFISSCSSPKNKSFEMNNLFPWCIVAYDSLERSPEARIAMMKELGFEKYAYDWRDHHLDDMAEELKLAEENGIEVLSVWLWLNAKRDSIGKLSPGNEKMFEILEASGLKTTVWLSFSNNYFKDLSQEESMKQAIEWVGHIASRVSKIGCDLALYNHKGWFGNPHNQVAIIESLAKDSIKMVFNFHHAHEYLDNFPQIIKQIKPYLSAVNLNGMKVGGPKIMPLGDGDLEKGMIAVLTEEGFSGPWGILGHVEGVDVEGVLKKNLVGLNKIKP